MTTTPDPQTVVTAREIVHKHLTIDGITVTPADIVGAVKAYFGDGTDFDTLQSWCVALRAELARSTITATVSWPDEAPLDGTAGDAAEGIARFLTHFREDSDDTVIEGLGSHCLTVGHLRGLIAEVRTLRTGAPRAWKQDWRDPVSRFENFVNATRNYDSDRLGGIFRGAHAEATITLGDLRSVLNRLAELEAHPWIVVPPAGDEQPTAEQDGDVRAYPGKPGDGWQDDDGTVWIHCADGQMRMMAPETVAWDPAAVDDAYGPMDPLDVQNVQSAPRLKRCPCGCKGGPDDCTCGGACRCSDCPHCDLRAAAEAEAALDARDADGGAS
jgi:hypothetical protein